MSDFAPALGRVPSGLFVLTCRTETEETAMLASWVQQCSFDPPMLSVAVRKGRDVIDWLNDGAAFAINILAEGQKELLTHFGKGLPLSQLSHAVERLEGRAPLLKEALAVLHCQPAGNIDAGDHILFLARIVDGALHVDAKPMVHVRKSGLNY